MQTTLFKGATATDLLKEKHELLLNLFRKVEETESDHRKKVIGDRCLREVEILSMLEKKIFYPAVRRDLGEDRLVAKALAEHENAERLINELKDLSAGERYNTRFRALREIVEPHIEEEAAGMIPRVEESDMDIEQLGQQMIELKSRLEPSAFKKPAVRGAAVVAGLAVAGAALWFATRGRRSR